jgi:hypothetical protein
MTVQEKEDYIFSLVHKIVEKNHSEELHQNFLDYVENGIENDSWNEYIEEVESRIGMKFKRGKERLEETEEDKNLLIAKLEEELKNMDYIMKEKDNYIVELVNKIIEKNHSEELESYVEVENELDVAKKASSLWGKYLKPIEARIGMNIKRGKQAQYATEEYKDSLIAKLEEEINSVG